jgi:hypothetical protein
VSEVAELVHQMLEHVFNERDAERRADAIATVFAEDVMFVDPEGVVRGHDALARRVQSILSEAPGFEFRLTAPIQEVADVGLDRWEFGPVDGEPVVRGTDVAIVDGGRIARLYTLIE